MAGGNVWRAPAMTTTTTSLLLPSSFFFFLLSLHGVICSGVHLFVSFTVKSVGEGKRDVGRAGEPRIVGRESINVGGVWLEDGGNDKHACMNILLNFFFAYSFRYLLFFLFLSMVCIIHTFSTRTYYGLVFATILCDVQIAFDLDFSFFLLLLLRGGASFYELLLYSFVLSVVLCCLHQIGISLQEGSLFSYEPKVQEGREVGNAFLHV